MVAALNIENVKYFSKENEEMKHSSAVVINNAFESDDERNQLDVQVIVDAGAKFQNVKLGVFGGAKGGRQKINYLNLQFQGCNLARTKFTAGKFGKLSGSIEIPEDCAGPIHLLRDLIGSAIWDTAQIPVNDKCLVYTDNNKEHCWIYVDVDEKDKFSAPLVNDEIFDCEKFNGMDKKKGTVTVRLVPYLWSDEDSSSIGGKRYYLSLKFKLVNIQC